MNTPHDQARLTNVEQDIIRLRKDVREDVLSLNEKLDAIIEAIASLRTHQAVDDVVSANSLQSIKANMCSDPGACARLTPRVVALEQQWSKWHDMQQQAKGAMKTVRAFWLGIGALVASALWVLQNYFTSK